MASLADMLKAKVSEELKSSVGSIFSGDTVSSVVNAGVEAFRKKAADKIAGTPEVQSAGERVFVAKVQAFFSNPLTLVGGVVLLVGLIFFVGRKRK